MAGQSILTAREWVLFEAFLQRPGQLFSKAQLEERLYSFDTEIDSNAIEVHVSRLRKKLGRACDRDRARSGLSPGAGIECGPRFKHAWRLPSGISVTLLWLAAAAVTAHRLGGEMEEVFDDGLKATAQRILPIARHDLRENACSS